LGVLLILKAKAALGSARAIKDKGKNALSLRGGGF
jgi:hypothetical protein